ncbi:hypothetical protein TSUD_223120 [Trifolium subterraneum]|uniref:Uncharacterized protein n=1 Tax=Trifolium subterraneum TaxID=3900 RepID=A0A2Z6M877_TRISU|nr:hypothetical protein TSUD_223120 [Trifolium subterraneum]
MAAAAAAAAAAVSGNPSLSSPSNQNEILTQPIYEVKAGNLIKIFPDYLNDIFIASNPGEFFVRLMLPEGFPNSVTSDYLEYSLWRAVQGVACQVSGVLATQALLYAVGLGKGAIPTAAAINWVLKDGIGYLSKILLSDFGRHFDVNPKGWRLFADLLENAAFGLEMCTPAFPHLFVPIGAFAGASRSAASLIQAQSIVLSSEAKDAAVEIESRLQLGSKLSEIINNKEEVLALFSLYKNEGYILSEHTGKFCVVLKENCSQLDMLKALFQVNYLYWLEKNAGIEGRGSLYDCNPGGRLQISLEYAEREFNHVRNDGESVGWITDGLIARPLPNRIRPGNTE